MRLLASLVLAALGFATTAHSQIAQEHEPNNTLSTANAVGLGDSIAGRVSLPHDVEYFVLELQAGMAVAIESTDLPWLTDWSWNMALLDEDGTVVALNDQYKEWLPGTRIWYPVSRAGRYFVRINNVPARYGTSPNVVTGDYPYVLRVTSLRAIAENEPNGDLGSAMAVAIGDTISGTLSTTSDRDFFALDLTAGTHISFAVSALEVSCDFIPEVTLRSPDGVELGRAESSPYNGSWNPLLEYSVTSTGRYFVTLDPDAPPHAGWITPCYFLKIGTFTPPPPGPAEPIRLFASGLKWYNSMATDGAGNIFLASGICETPERRATQRVARLGPDGRDVVLADTQSLTSDVIVDGFGDLLVAGFRNDTYEGVVWRIAPNGERTILAQGLTHPCGLALGPDGDVWVAEKELGHVLRLDPLGNVKDTIEFPLYVEHMAFSPNGVLHFFRINQIHKFEGGTTTLLWTTADNSTTYPFIFDRDGELYTVKGGYFGYDHYNKVVRLDADGEPTVDPVAWVNQPIGFTFARSGDGAPTNRLLVLVRRLVNSHYETEIDELNSAGIRAPGAAFALSFKRVALDDLRAAQARESYTDTMRVSNDNTPGTWSIINGSLPHGITLDARSGALSGVPADTGTFAMTVRKVSGGDAAIGRLTLTVAEPAAPRIAESDVVDGVLGLKALAADVVQFLDSQGNKNGILDAGDLRAYLRSQGRVAN
jgi:Putative Ig domain